MPEHTAVTDVDDARTEELHTYALPLTRELPVVEDDARTEELRTLEMQFGFEAERAFERQLSAGHHDTGALTAVQEHEADLEPTTIALPVAGGAEAVVVEPEPHEAFPSADKPPRRARLALVALAAGAFVTGTNEASIVALGPLISSGLDVPLATVGLLATAFALTIVLAAFPLTLATAKLSKRTTITGAFVLWTVGVVLAATSTTFAQLAVGRVVSASAHGLFWAIVAPTAASLFAPHLRAKSVTCIMLGAAVAGVVGTPLVTLVGDRVGWQVPYFALSGLGVLVAIAVALVLPGRTRRDGAAPAEHVIGDVPDRGAFIRVVAVAFTVTVAMSSTWTYVVAIYTGDAGIPVGAVPVLFAVGGVVAVIATLIVPRFLVRNVVQTVTVGLLVLAGAFALLLLPVAAAAVAAQVLQAAGWAVLIAGLLNWAMRHTPVRTDIGASIYTVVANGGGAVGPVVGSAVVATWGTAALPGVSLLLTAVAATLATGFDARTIRRLAVPRQVRMAVAARFAELERHQWGRRVFTTVSAPLLAARLVGHHAGRFGEAAGRGAVRAGASVGKGTVKAGVGIGRGAVKASTSLGKGAVKAGSSVSKGAAKASSSVSKGAAKAGDRVSKSTAKARDNVAKSVKRPPQRPRD